MSMKNSSDTIGNRTRVLPACSALPQPTAPPCAPSWTLEYRKMFSHCWETSPNYKLSRTCHSHNSEVWPISCDGRNASNKYEWFSLFGSLSQNWLQGLIEPCSMLLHIVLMNWDRVGKCMYFTKYELCKVAICMGNKFCKTVWQVSPQEL